MSQEPRSATAEPAVRAPRVQIVNKVLLLLAVDSHVWQAAGVKYRIFGVLPTSGTNASLSCGHVLQAASAG